MRITRLLMMAAIAAAIGCGAAPQLDTRTFELRHIDAGTALALIEPYIFAEREGAPGAHSVAGSVITVRERPENLEEIAAVLSRYDRPQPGVRLHFRLIEADGYAETDPAIADVETELRELFRFEGYRLAADASMQGMERSMLSQVLATGRVGYRIGALIDNVSATDDGGVVKLHVSLEHLGLGDILETAVNVRDGQTVVLGTAKPRGDQGALILVVTPELQRLPAAVPPDAGER